MDVVSDAALPQGSMGSAIGFCRVLAASMSGYLVLLIQLTKTPTLLALQPD